MRRILVVLVVLATMFSVSGTAYSSTATTTAAAASVHADFNDDGHADLAVGVPFEDISGTLDAGAVNVLYGSGAKLTGAGGQVFHQDSAGVGGTVEMGDLFGGSLAASGPQSVSASAASPASGAGTPATTLRR